MLKCVAFVLVFKKQALLSCCLQVCRYNDMRVLILNLESSQEPLKLRIRASKNFKISLQSTFYPFAFDYQVKGSDPSFDSSSDVDIFLLTINYGTISLCNYWVISTKLSEIALKYLWNKIVNSAYNHQKICLFSCLKTLIFVMSTTLALRKHGEGAKTSFCHVM